jgi:hypothetical protein
MITKAICDGLADELEKRGFHVRRFDSSDRHASSFWPTFHVVDKPWNEEDDDIALRYAIHAQDDGYLIADHVNYSEDAKNTTLVPYDVPDMLERILCILGE